MYHLQPTNVNVVSLNLSHGKHTATLMCYFHAVEWKTLPEVAQVHKNDTDQGSSWNVIGLRWCQEVTM